MKVFLRAMLQVMNILSRQLLFTLIITNNPCQLQLHLTDFLAKKGRSYENNQQWVEDIYLLTRLTVLMKVLIMTCFHVRTQQWTQPKWM